MYTDFEIIKETCMDGFCYGEITDHLLNNKEDECLSGDGFVQAPDGSRAGIIWEITDVPSLSICIEPEKDRFGVYYVGFVKPIKTIEDLVFNLKMILPFLKKAYKEAEKYT